LKSELDIDALNAAFGRGDRVRFVESRLGGPVAELACPSGTAMVALQGAQVLSWRPGGMQDVFWLSPQARLGTGKSVRGGVPVCWPWFGPHPSDPAKPSHGFVRAATWEVVGSAGATGAAAVTLAYETNAATSTLWPCAARLSLTVTLAADLRLDLTTENLGGGTISITQALHTYFAVHEVEATRVEGLDGRTYIDSIDGNARKPQHGAIRIDREVDRIYIGSGDRVSLVDPLLGRRIDIDTHGSASTVVWNPWSEKAQRLGDVGEDGFRRFVCIETANAGPDTVPIPPGEAHRLAARYSVAPAT